MLRSGRASPDYPEAGTAHASSTARRDREAAHVRRKENRNAGGTLDVEPCRWNRWNCSTPYFETDGGRIDAMWSDVRLHAGDIPDGWHCYAVRGGDGGWPPCSIEKTVWVNHAGDIITPDDLDPLLERNGWMLVIRDWWFTDEPFGRAE